LVSGIIEKKLKAGLLSSACIFVAINLVYGLREGVDNAAHIGGLVSGLLIGFLMAAEVKWKKLHLFFKVAGVLLPLLLVFLYINTVHTKDVDFGVKLIEIATLDSDADWPIKSKKGKSDNQLAGEMERTSIPKWTEVSTLLKSYKPKELNTFNRNLHGLLIDYTSLRLKEAQLYIQKADDSAAFSTKELEMVQEQIDSKQRILAGLKR
jgi:rhomboid protease GluP